MAVSLLCLRLHWHLLVSGLGEECVQLTCCGQQNQQRGERLHHQPDNQAGRRDNHTAKLSAVVDTVVYVVCIVWTVSKSAQCILVELLKSSSLYPCSIYTTLQRQSASASSGQRCVPLERAETCIFCLAYTA